MSSKTISEMSPITLIGAILLPLMAMGVVMYLNLDSKIWGVNKSINDLTLANNVHFQKIEDALAQAAKDNVTHHQEVMENFEGVGLVTGDLKDQYHLSLPVFRHKIDSLMREIDKLKKSQHP